MRSFPARCCGKSIFIAFYCKMFRNSVFVLSRAFSLSGLIIYQPSTSQLLPETNVAKELPRSSPFPVSASGPFRMVIINAPKVFSIAWTFVKPQLDEKTVAKISIFGSDQREALHGRKDDKSRSARKKSRAKMSKD